MVDPPKLYAVSDLHLGYRQNRQLLMELPAHESDWLVVVGDVGETETHLRYAWRVLGERFARLIWVPGNHELWTAPDSTEASPAKYERLVAMCRQFGVLTPEDPYPVWHGGGGPCVLAPLFLLYDYSFRPVEISAENAVFWAMESGVLCADEQRINPSPFASMLAWCADRLRVSEGRLAAEQSGFPRVLINHFPLRSDLVHLPTIPRFSIWCGTTQTSDWHRRFGARVVVSGHLHTPRTDWRDGVRFEEVSLGNPGQRNPGRPAESFLREILPGLV